ncbi:MAG: hypothetical protein NTX59_05675 [Elusimicrobia bacterium]|nr:hypothetical protein [Elusimicrobiota bacterium]
MTAAILIVLLLAPAAYAQTDTNNAEIDAQIQKTAGDINTMLGAMMTESDNEGKAGLNKKLDALKSVRGELGEELLLRLQLYEELQKIQPGIQYLGQITSSNDPAAAAAGLDTLKKIEKTLSAALDQTQLKAIKEKTEADLIKGALSALRSATMVYYGDKEGLFPYDLSVLTENSKYLTSIPSIMPPGHNKPSNAVKLVSEVTTMDELITKVDDAGGWIYVSDKSSPLWGTVIINCNHKDVNASKTYMYSY